MNCKTLLLFIFCSCFLLNAKGQTPIGIRGFVYTKSANTERLGAVLITNKRKHNYTYTDDLGNFTIKTTIGDTLDFTKTDFNPAQIVVTEGGDLAVFIQKVVHLSQVEIKGLSKQQELNAVINNYRSKGLYFDGRPPIWVFSPFSGSPITGFYELFGRDARNERRFIKFSRLEIAASQDHSKYNKELVKRVSGLPDDELQKFMDTFTPTHQELLKWNDYEVIAYIKKSMESYKRNGAKDLPRLY
jgi:hypothetical protein